MVQNKSATPTAPPDKVKPAKPKGTPNAYALFYKETYGKLRSENPDWKASQIMAEAGRIWKEMNGALQQRYRAQAESLGNSFHAGHSSMTRKIHKNLENSLTFEIVELLWRNVGLWMMEAVEIIECDI